MDSIYVVFQTVIWVGVICNVTMTHDDPRMDKTMFFFFAFWPIQRQRFYLCSPRQVGPTLRLRAHNIFERWGPNPVVFSLSIYVINEMRQYFPKLAKKSFIMIMAEK
ncbi:hypothetical protein AAZX31_01G195700 [Glycine max]